MELATYLMDSEGRFARSSWFFRMLVVAITCVAFGMLANEILGNTGAAIFAALFIWRAISISIRWLHDCDKSGNCIFLLLIPVLGPVWLLWLLTRKGSEGKNRYGFAPRSNRNYLKVDISNNRLNKMDTLSVNDVAQINPIHVFGIAAPRSVQELQSILRNSTIPVSTGGGHFSMGGHTASPGTLHLDLRQMNEVIHFDTQVKTIRVESGIRWCDIQKLIDPHGLSIKIMQTYVNFTVGGALSVNAHGRYIGLGPVVMVN